MVLILIIIIIIWINKPIYKPVWTIGTKAPVDLDTEVYYEVLLPIKKIPNGDKLLTPQEIKSTFLDYNYSKVIDLLNRHGDIIWESPSGTMMVIKTTPRKIPVKLYTFDQDQFPATLNNRWTLISENKEIIFRKINLELEDGIKTLNSKQWSEKYNLMKQPLGSPPGNFYDIDSTSSQDREILPRGGFIGLMENPFTYPNINGLQNLAIKMGFPSDKFVNQIIQAQASPNTQGYVILDNQFSNDNLSEVDVDLQSIFSVNPDITCMIFFHSYFILSPLWISASNPLFPNIWSSSLFFSQKSNIQDRLRLHQEYKLLSLAGITTFQSSGDQGNYASQMTNNNFNGDISKIDIQEAIFDSPFTITVGGFNYSKDTDNYGFTQKTPMSGIYNISEQDSTSRPYDTYLYASGGGFDRGVYSDPYWKLRITNKYRNTNAHLVKIKQLPNGLIVPFEELSFDSRGNSSPDLIGIGSGFFYNQDKESAWGTSISAPYIACIFASIEKSIDRPIINLCQTLYNNRNLMSRPLEGRNNFFNVYGYPTGQDWDPVQGLGIPDAKKWLEFFKNQEY